MSEDPADVMAENLAIGERAIDRRAHRAEVALADFRIDRRAGEFAVGKIDTGLFRGHHHFLQELGSDLMAEATRTAMDGDDNVVPCEPEDSGDRRVENLGDRLDLEIVIAGAERPHFPALAFPGAVRHAIGPGASHPALLLDSFVVARLAPAAPHRP